jgi:hypothetical protein
MSGWDYYLPGNAEALPKIRLPGPASKWDELTETVGASELPLMRRARVSANGRLVLTHGRSNNRARLAARRLVLRGLLERGTLGNLRTGYLHTYRLTERGRTCWLRARR